MADLGDDIVIDMLLRMQRAFGIDAENSMVAAVERDVRQHWGGERVYIGKTKNDREELNQRNMSIVLNWQQGERASLLARRYKLSAHRIRQIIRSARKRKLLP